MHASRKILLKHFDARAAEYRKDIMDAGNLIEDHQTNSGQMEKPVITSFSIAFLIPEKVIVALMSLLCPGRDLSLAVRKLRRASEMDLRRGHWRDVAPAICFHIHNCLCTH